MMTCAKCRKHFEKQQGRCPHCGEPNPDVAGMYQTSSVLIAAAGTHTMYRSVEEVPARLRSKLLKSTNGANSATILIADRRGRKEIACAMRIDEAGMDQSLKARFRPGQPVDLTLLGNTERRLTARVTDVSGRRLALELPEAVSPGRAIRIESGDEAFSAKRFVAIANRTHTSLA